MIWTHGQIFWIKRQDKRRKNIEQIIGIGLKKSK